MLFFKATLLMCSIKMLPEYLLQVMYKDTSCDKTTEYLERYCLNHLSHAIRGVLERFIDTSLQLTRRAHHVSCLVESNDVSRSALHDHTLS